MRFLIGAAAVAAGLICWPAPVPALAGDPLQHFEFPEYSVDLWLEDTDSGCILANAQLNNFSARDLGKVEIDVHADFDTTPVGTMVIDFPPTGAKTDTAKSLNSPVGPRSCSDYTVRVEGTVG
ncbi:MAG TPA: hypothetical protein VMH86_09045 [Rhizomicrobium sp.]|nr:hypothetical protein [Rhizomicrobium sp.]